MLVYSIFYLLCCTLIITQSDLVQKKTGVTSSLVVVEYM